MKQALVITAIIFAFLAGILGAFLGRSHLSFISADVTELANDLGQERSKNITLSSELNTTASLLNQRNSQLREISNQFQDAQNEFSRLSIEFASCPDQLREKSNQLREAQEQIKQLASRAENAEASVKALEPKKTKGPSLKDRWETVITAKTLLNFNQIKQRMGESPAFRIRGQVSGGNWEFSHQTLKWEWEQSDWENIIFPRYKVNRTKWPSELQNLLDAIYSKTTFPIESGNYLFIIYIYIIDPDTALGIHYVRLPSEIDVWNTYDIDGVRASQGCSFSITLPRSAFPEVK